MSSSDLLAMTKQTADAVDDVLRVFWERVALIIQAMPSRATQRDRREAMRQIDQEIAYYFGATRALAVGSLIQRTFDLYLTRTANLPPQRMIAKVRAAVEARNPDLWLTILRQANPASPDPFLRAVSMTAPTLRPVTIEPAPVRVTQERILRAKSLDTNRRWVKAPTADTPATNYRLSDRVWKLGRQNRTAIDDRLRLGISRGEDALKIADDLVRHLRPSQQPEIITANGQIIRRRNLTLAPGRGGYGSYQARRLARTETTRVHGEATIQMMKVTPGGKGIQWRLSASHPKRDICDEYANADTYGLGRGVYPVDRVPPYPAHPHELCALVPVMKSRDDVIAELVRKYGV